MEPTAPSIPPDLRDAWDHHIREALSTEEGPSVQALLAEAHRRGVARTRALRALGHRCAGPEVQQAWTDTLYGADREEVRLRLELMAQFDTLDPGLESEVLFFFRASDPGHYQAAAQVLGAQLHDHPAFRDFLQSYLDQRSVRLDAPISLNGERAHRRLLIVAAARRAHAPSTPVLDLDRAESYLEASPLDLNAVLIATRIVLEAEAPSSEWTAFGLSLLNGLPDTSTVDDADPSLIRSWGRLFAGLAPRAFDRARAAWKAMLQRVAQPPDDAVEDSFASSLQRLVRLDEVVHSALLLPDDERSALRDVLSTQGGKRLSLFFRYRWHLWSGRQGVSSPGLLGALMDRMDASSAPILYDLARAEVAPDEPGTVLGTGSVQDRRHARFLDLLRTLDRKDEWLRRDREQRALIAFTVLDFSRYLPLPTPAVDATLDALDFPELRDPPGEQSQRPASTGRAGPTTFRVVLRLAEWETAGTERLIGTHLLHQITDPYVLRMLLPTGTRTELTAPLADAIEHQLRLRLKEDPTFQPVQFLHETTIRAPHSSFYDDLLRVCRARTYTDAEDQPVPVDAIVERLRDEARLLRKDTLDADAVPDWPGDSAYDREVRYVRRTLTSIATSTDLIGGLEALAEEALDPTVRDPKTGARGIFGILSETASPSAPLVHRTEVPDFSFTSRGVQTELQELGALLQDAVPALNPAHLADAYRLRDDALVVEEVLDRLEARICPVVEILEATLLRRAIRRLRSQLSTWTGALTAAHALWRDRHEEGASPDAVADELFDWIQSRPADSIRHQLVVLLSRTLTEFRPDTEPQTWREREALLRWALRDARLDALAASEREPWLEAFTTLLEDLAREAMEEGHESRVLRLSTDEDFAPVRTRASTASLFEEVRRWCLDRYHVPAASQLTSVLQAHPEASGVTGTAMAFVVHFSRVWVALLLGAILMLDFGGAWTAMAAEGDVSSVVVTFVVGVVGTLGYLFVDLGGKVKRAPEDPGWRALRSQWIRLVAFLGVCLVVTAVLTTGLWFLLSGTDEVVRGPGAVLHIVVWTGFALFVGVFFGLLAEAG